jgi:KUP system potassium uptake protein
MGTDLQGSLRAAASASTGGQQHPAQVGKLALTIGAIGVVYGDIGTSPLYAMREAVHAAVGPRGAITEPVIFGLLSLIFWALIVVVTLKYIALLLRADNNGEGGILSLTALVFRALGKTNVIVLALGMIGAAMFYGSTLITPALSVLSAVEGLKVATPAFDPYILPLAVVILVTLFAVQSRGTASVSTFFGPLTTLWFLIMAVAGIVHIAGNPAVLLAINPAYGVAFLADHGFIGLVTLGAVFLVVTGSEALYNDLGHFGRKPIQAAWIFLVLPALVLNYFGQGALLLANPAAIENPFFFMFPEWLLYPMIALATAATVIASQAVITGSYSITQQAVQLGLLPRLEIRHTSESLAGQIYMPRVNWLLLTGVMLLVLLFRSSSALAGAYVLAVANANLMSTLLGFVVLWRVWRWSLLATVAVMALFVFVDGVFVIATSLDILRGAWLPVLVAALIVLIMGTWRRGTRVLFEKTRRLEVPLIELIHNLEKHPPPRITGTAVFLTGDPDSTPTALLHSLKHFKVLHEKNVIMTVKFVDLPRVDEAGRLTIGEVGNSFTRITVRYGFMETPHLPKALAIVRKEGLSFDIMSTTFFLSRRVLRASKTSGMPIWQDRIFIMLARGADDASSYFRLPTDRVVEIGTQVSI